MLSIRTDTNSRKLNKRQERNSANWTTSNAVSRTLMDLDSNKQKKQSFSFSTASGSLVAEPITNTSTSVSSTSGYTSQLYSQHRIKTSDLKQRQSHEKQQLHFGKQGVTGRRLQQLYGSHELQHNYRQLKPQQMQQLEKHRSMLLEGRRATLVPILIDDDEIDDELQYEGEDGHSYVYDYAGALHLQSDVGAPNSFACSLRSNRSSDDDREVDFEGLQDDKRCDDYVQERCESSNSSNQTHANIPHHFDHSVAFSPDQLFKLDRPVRSMTSLKTHQGYQNFQQPQSISFVSSNQNLLRQTAQHNKKRQFQLAYNNQYSQQDQADRKLHPPHLHLSHSSIDQQTSSGEHRALPQTKMTPVSSNPRTSVARQKGGGGRKLNPASSISSLARKSNASITNFGSRQSPAENEKVGLGWCGKLAKLLLFVANLLFWTAGISLGAWGILSLVDDHKYNLSQLLVFEPNGRMSLFQLLSWSFIALGCATILVGVCGCSAILKNNKWILGLYIFLILAIFALDLATGLLAIIFQERLVANVRLRLINKLRSDYGVHASFTAAIDYIQTKFECCGLEGHYDYDQSLWRLQRLGGFEATVARTCCHLRNSFDNQAHINPRPVNESMCQSNDVRFHQSYRYRKGCLDDLERLIRQKIWAFIIGCGLAGLVILLSLLFATCFCRSIPTTGSRKLSTSMSGREQQARTHSAHHQKHHHYQDHGTGSSTAQRHHR